MTTSEDTIRRENPANRNEVVYLRPAAYHATALYMGILKRRAGLESSLRLTDAEVDAMVAAMPDGVEKTLVSRAAVDARTCDVTPPRGGDHPISWGLRTTWEASVRYHDAQDELDPIVRPQITPDSYDDETCGDCGLRFVACKCPC